MKEYAINVLSAAFKLVFLKYPVNEAKTLPHP